MLETIPKEEFFHVWNPMVNKGIQKYANEIVRGTREALKHWMTAKIPFRIEDKSIKIHPKYISSSFWHKFVEQLKFSDGIMIGDKPIEFTKSCIRLNAQVGKDKRGSSVMYGGFDDVDYRKKPIRKQLEGNLDPLIKITAESYMNGIAQSIRLERPTEIHLQKGNKKIIYHQEYNPRGITRGNMIKDVEEIIRELDKVPGVIRCESTIDLAGFENIFVDTIGSDIRQYKEFLEIRMKLWGVENKKHEEFIISNGFLVSGKSRYKKKRLEITFNEIVSDFEARKKIATMNSGLYPVMMDGQAAAVFIHEALAAHLLSGRYITEDISTLFKDRLGSIILPEYISIIDDPSLKNQIGSYMYDDEGVKAKKVVLVEKGKLMDYLLDNVSAAKLMKQGIERESNGHSRSEWGTMETGGLIIPEPRISNLLVESENLMEEPEFYDSFLKTIKDSHSKYGIIVEGGGGRVNVGEGFFAMYPRKVWRVDQRGNKKMIKNVHLTGNAEETLRSIIATGKPYSSCTGECGADSGYVPTEQNSPSFLFPQLQLVSEPKGNSTPRILPWM
jgi:predicted Zn-dependent protease